MDSCCAIAEQCTRRDSHVPLQSANRDDAIDRVQSPVPLAGLSGRPSSHQVGTEAALERAGDHANSTWLAPGVQDKGSDTLAPTRYDGLGEQKDKPDPTYPAQDCS